VVVVAALVVVAPPLDAITLNSAKYGAMISWNYRQLPDTNLYPPTMPWISNSDWWDGIVRQARDAGLGWFAPDCWGEDSDGDPATLAPLVAAIDRAGSPLKIALFDDTTSEVLRKNRARGRGWTLEPRFDLSDLEGRGEGGLTFFYEQQWKRFFQTVPPRLRLTIDGRPVVFMWHGGAEWYERQNFFHDLIRSLREATRRDFNVDPYVIVEESWLRLDPASSPDAIYDWFQPPKVFATLMPWNGVRVGHVVPGFDCSKCNPPSPIVERQGGAIFQAALQAVAPSADLVLIEGFVNVDENAHLIETSTWGRLYLAITRWFTSNVP